VGKPKKPKRKRRLQDKEQWYQLVSMFDDKDIQTTPIKGAFFRGVLDKTVIVEVQQNFPQEQYGPLAEWLEKNGIEAMVVKEGVRFLKIRPATEDQETVLETHYQEELATEAAQKKEAAKAAS